MATALIINRQNNLGDAICLMRGIKEWKEKYNHVVDFVTVFPMHIEAAWHTEDLFRDSQWISHERMEYLIQAYKMLEYERMIVDFNMDWTESVRVGFVEAYCKLNFGFIPSTNKPFFVPKREEFVFTKFITDRLRGVGWEKLALIQGFSVSNPARSFPFEDIHEICELFPASTMVLMPCGVHDPFHVTLNPFPPNVIVMPGFPIGHTAALMTHMDLNLMVHGAYSHIAYAVDAPNVIQVNFYATGSINFAVPGATNLNFETNEEDYITPLQEAIDRILVG